MTRENLALLGIDENLYKAMQLELQHKAPWVNRIRREAKPVTGSTRVKQADGSWRIVELPKPEDGGKFRYPLQQMQIGDSFFSENGDRTIHQNANSLNSCIACARRKTGFKFKTQRKNVPKGGGIYVVRVA